MFEICKEIQEMIKFGQALFCSLSSKENPLIGRMDGRNNSPITEITIKCTVFLISCFIINFLAAQKLGLFYSDIRDLIFVTNDDGTLVDSMQQLKFLSENTSPVILLSRNCTWVSYIFSANNIRKYPCEMLICKFIAFDAIVAH